MELLHLYREMNLPCPEDEKRYPVPPGADFSRWYDPQTGMEALVVIDQLRRLSFHVHRVKKAA